MAHSFPRQRAASPSVYSGQLSLFDILPILLPNQSVVSLPDYQLTRIPTPTAPVRTPLVARDALFCLPHDWNPPGGTRTKVGGNLNAIRLIQELRTVARPLTSAERLTLANYVGWGELSSLWDADGYEWFLAQQEAPGIALTDAQKGWNKTFGTVRHELETLLTPAEREEAALSTVNAFYTSPLVIRAMWQLIERLGFSGGDILEPAAAIGHFMGLMPLSIREYSRVTAVEKDPLSAAMLTALYPEVTSHAAPFETVQFGEEKETFDLVIGNVPFGDFKVFDRRNRDLGEFFIHNYFIGRSARLLRSGGLMALITSAGTMDSGSTTFRKALAAEGVDLVGAVRLPSCTFKKNSGTQVTTDILVFQKRPAQSGSYQTPPFAHQTFLETVTVFTESKEEDSGELARSIVVNEYFAERPHLMLGNMTFADAVNMGGLYGADRQTLFLANAEELAARLQTAIELFPQGIYQKTPAPYNPLNQPKTGLGRLDSFSGAVSIGKRLFKKSLIIEQYEALKSAFRDMLRVELAAEPDEVCDRVREVLRETYGQFTRHFGKLNRNRHLSFLEEWDAQFPTVQALENVQRNADKTYTITKATILNERVYRSAAIPDKVDSLSDALQLSMYATGGISIYYISDKYGKAPDVVRDELIKSELAFVCPESGRLIDRVSYLSGEVRTKLHTVEQHLLEQPELTPNYTALQKVLPDPIPVSLIAFGLGSNWLPNELLTEFISQHLDLAVHIKVDPDTRQYIVDSTRVHSAKNDAAGTKERKGIELVEAALNSRSIVVTKTVYVNGEKTEVKDMEATSAAVQAQEAIQEAFNEFARENYGEWIESIFNDRFNNYVPKTYALPTINGHELTHYPGANPAICLRKHQIRATERIKETDTLLAHVVGSGKTFTMISAAMELKRLGKVTKTVIAVQNSTVADFGRACKRLYPAALVYIPDKADLEASNRKRFLQRIATNPFDLIILPNSFLKLIPDDPTDEEIFLREEFARSEGNIKHLAGHSPKRKKTVKEINKAKLRMVARRQAQGARQTDSILHFGQLGVTCLMLDECHTKKRLGFATNRRNIKGIDTQGSQDALQALLKCRTVQRKGGRVVLATGTPISNTMAEAWTMLRFIAPERLARVGCDTFDGFAGAFGSVVPSFEMTTSGQFRAVDRFAKFVNVPQLSALYREQVDVVMNDDIEEFKRDNTLPTLKDGRFTEVILPQTPGVAAELAEIRSVLVWYDKLPAKDKRDNSHIPLVMYGQARKATLDIRLLDADNEDEEGAKGWVAVERIARKYHELCTVKGIQLVFADLFQSPAMKGVLMEGAGTSPDRDALQKRPNRFNLFADMRQKLIAKGIPAHEIAIVPEDANKREPVFEQVRSGAIRILFGTSERMGVGVNVQERLGALHHLDAPNRPTDFEQRNGRMIRQGNLFAEWGIPVEIFTYGVDKTLDATAYGRMAIKKKFINQVLQGTVTDAEMGDLSSEDDFMSMSFEGMMATLSGSQYAITYTVKKHELSRLYQQRKNYERGLREAQARIELARRTLSVSSTQLPKLQLEADLFRQKWGTEGVTLVEIDGVSYKESTGIAGWTAATERLFMEIQMLAKRGRNSKKTIIVNGLMIGLEGVLAGYDRVTGKAEYATSYAWGLTLKGGVLTGQGFYTSLRATANDVLEAPFQTKRDIQKAQAEEIEFGKKVNEPFKKVESITRLEGELETLKRLMETETV